MPALPEILRSVDLFESLSDRNLERLADTLEERAFSEGDAILTEGQGGLGFYVIGEGTVTYSVNGKDVGSGGPGEYFGEVALIGDSPRAATVTAASDVTVHHRGPAHASRPRPVRPDDAVVVDPDRDRQAVAEAVRWRVAAGAGVVVVEAGDRSNQSGRPMFASLGSSRRPSRVVSVDSIWPVEPGLRSALREPPMASGPVRPPTHAMRAGHWARGRRRGWQAAEARALPAAPS